MLLYIVGDEDAADDFQDRWIKENPEKFEVGPYLTHNITYMRLIVSGNTRLFEPK